MEQITLQQIDFTNPTTFIASLANKRLDWNGSSVDQALCSTIVMPDIDQITFISEVETGQAFDVTQSPFTPLLAMFRRLQVYRTFNSTKIAKNTVKKISVTIADDTLLKIKFRSSNKKLHNNLLRFISKSWEGTPYYFNFGGNRRNLSEFSHKLFTAFDNLAGRPIRFLTIDQPINGEMDVDVNTISIFASIYGQTLLSGVITEVIRWYAIKHSFQTLEHHEAGSDNEESYDVWIDEPQPYGAPTTDEYKLHRFLQKHFAERLDDLRAYGQLLDDEALLQFYIRECSNEFLTDQVRTHFISFKVKYFVSLGDKLTNEEDLRSKWDEKVTNIVDVSKRPLFIRLHNSNRCYSIRNIGERESMEYRIGFSDTRATSDGRFDCTAVSQDYPLCQLSVFGGLSTAGYKEFMGYSIKSHPSNRMQVNNVARGHSLQYYGQLGTLFEISGSESYNHNSNARDPSMLSCIDMANQIHVAAVHSDSSYTAGRKCIVYNTMHETLTSITSNPVKAVQEGTFCAALFVPGHLADDSIRTQVADMIPRHNDGSLFSLEELWGRHPPQVEWEQANFFLEPLDRIRRHLDYLQVKGSKPQMGIRFETSAMLRIMNHDPQNRNPITNTEELFGLVVRLAKYHADNMKTPQRTLVVEGKVLFKYMQMSLLVLQTNVQAAALKMVLQWEAGQTQFTLARSNHFAILAMISYVATIFTALPNSMSSGFKMNQIVLCTNVLQQMQQYAHPFCYQNALKFQQEEGPFSGLLYLDIDQHVRERCPQYDSPSNFSNMPDYALMAVALRLRGRQAAFVNQVKESYRRHMSKIVTADQSANFLFVSKPETFQQQIETAGHNDAIGLELEMLEEAEHIPIGPNLVIVNHETLEQCIESITETTLSHVCREWVLYYSGSPLCTLRSKKTKELIPGFTTKIEEEPYNNECTSVLLHSFWNEFQCTSFKDAKITIVEAINFVLLDHPKWDKSAARMFVDTQTEYIISKFGITNDELHDVWSKCMLRHLQLLPQPLVFPIMNKGRVLRDPKQFLIFNNE